MNERTGRTAAAALLLPAVALAGAGGCANPFRTYESDYGVQPRPERVLEVDPIDLQNHTVPQSERAGAEEAFGPDRFDPDRFADLDRVELSLEQARAWTLENNLDLRVALINPAIANQTLNEEEARWEAVFLANVRRTETDQPTATQLSGSQIESTDVSTGVEIPLRTGGRVTVNIPVNETETNNPFSTLNPSTTADLEVSISQPLLRGGGRQAETHALRVAAYQRSIELARTKLEVIRQIAAADRAYWRLFAAIRAFRVSQQQYELAAEQLERARRRFNAGAVAEIEVTRAEEGVAQRLEDIIVAENDVRLQQRELKRIVNVPQLGLETLPLLEPATDPDPVPFVLDPGELTEKAVANRMELLELELQLAIDASTIAFQENQALPLFTIDYTYRLNGLGGNASGAFDQLFENNFEDWSLGLNAEVPIGNEAAEARVARAVIERLQRLSTRDARRLAIEQEVRDAIDGIEAGWQRVLATRQSTLLAARTLAAEQRQFDVGRSTSNDVLDAATRLAEAQLAEIRALSEYEIAQVDLAFATGTMLGSARIRWEPLDPRDRERRYEDEPEYSARTVTPGR